MNENLPTSDAPGDTPEAGAGRHLETGTARDLETGAGAGAAAVRFARARNVLIGIGAFYVSRWLAALLRTALTALVEGAMSADGLRQALLTPFITSLSHALAAASAGAVVVLLVDSTAASGPPHSLDSSGSSGSSGAPGSTGSPGSTVMSARWRWAAIPAVLWFVASLDEVTISAPGWIHLISQLIAAALPSIVCLAAGHLADWHRSR